MPPPAAVCCPGAPLPAAGNEGHGESGICHKMSRFTPKQLLGLGGKQAGAAREVSVPFPRSFQTRSCVRDRRLCQDRLWLGTDGEGAPKHTGGLETPLWGGDWGTETSRENPQGAEIPHEGQFLLPHGERETPDTSWEPQTPHTS